MGWCRRSPWAHSGDSSGAVQGQCTVGTAMGLCRDNAWWGQQWGCVGRYMATHPCPTASTAAASAVSEPRWLPEVHLYRVIWRLLRPTCKPWTSAGAPAFPTPHLPAAWRSGANYTSEVSSRIPFSIMSWRSFTLKPCQSTPHPYLSSKISSRTKISHEEKPRLVPVPGSARTIQQSGSDSAGWG